jgi:ABC-type phosphate/phosphonate transport system permease subunit
MEQLEVTWLRATMVWWSIFWRSLVIAIAAGAVAGFVIGVALAAIGRSDLVEIWGRLIGVVVAVPAGIWAVRSVLKKEYRQFRIVLVPSAEARLEQLVRDDGS